MKNKVTGYRLQVVVAMLFLLFTITYHLSPTTSLADNSSPSGSLIQKLNELKNDIASKAAQIKSEVQQVYYPNP